MSRYDFTATSDFLELEAGITPNQLYDEIQDAMSDIDSLRNKRNEKKVSAIWHTLLTCADFLECITEKETA